jgi:CHASE2 domain-containing sensor protein
LTTCRDRREAQIKSTELGEKLKATWNGAIARARTFLFSKRFLRSSLAVVTLLILTWIFGQTGILDKLDRVATDIQFRLNPVPYDTAVVLMIIDDDDYKQLFDGTSPLNRDKLFELVNDIAKGSPSVIGVDIDTSSPEFAQGANTVQCNCAIVWEQEVAEIPEAVGANTEMKKVPILGGRTDTGDAATSSGIPILIDDPEGGDTRRYQRYFPTESAMFPSFSSAISIAYSSATGKPLIQALTSPSEDEHLIRFSGDHAGSHRIRMSAAKLHELSQTWSSGASPIKDRIVLLGGSYLGQDLHQTPLGQMNGVEVLANVIETELNGGGARAPGRFASYLLEVFEAFGLILIFHFFPLRKALLWSCALIPALALICSWVAYRAWTHIGHFIVVLVGLLLFELYEHFRRHEFPELITRGPAGHGE